MTLFILAVAFGLWALLRKRPEPPLSSSIGEVRKAVASNEMAVKDVQIALSTPTTPNSANKIITNASVSQERLSYAEQVRKDPLYDWKQPINFYGKVLDENTNPVPGAGVDYTWSTLSETGARTQHDITDASGLFSIHETGSGIGITVSKKGYYTTPNERLRNFEYANHGEGVFSPDPNNPIVFHLQKKGLPEKLIHGSKLFGSRVDGTLSYVDLATAKNKLTSPGDLIVQCTRSERASDKKFDWTFTLAIPDGGLMESTNAFMFLAPEEGYRATFQINHKINDVDWVGQEKHKFFVKSQNGQHYARIEITIMPDYGQNAAYDLEWFLNPSGSRNLEYDPDNAAQAGQ
jgi:hypothetical protein